METPFRLIRRDTAAPADAALVFAAGYDRLASAVRHALPAVFPVRGGFLLVGTAAPPPGAVRLRRLRGDLYLPADADLVPALLPDEAVALTRSRGLVFLPGGTILSFDPARPLAVADWLRPAAVRRDEWEPFPPRPDSVDRLTVIEGPTRQVLVEDILRAGEPDDADPLPGPGESEAGVPEDARPPGGSVAGRAAAGAALAAGGFLAWLGRQLGMGGLARAGANLAARALTKVPRLSEKLLGAQEAALRNLLRQLQSGDIEKALRRAPAAVADPERPASIGTGADLGRRDPRYSLRDLLSGGGGRAVTWFGGGDVWALLAAEYRRLAAEAVARGDHRRAAYLFGVLLRDPRAAANALMTGGLFRDAAILFRDRLKDDAAAAAAFDRAGDYDEAVRLYDRAKRWESAGDLLKRLGDDAAAFERFQRAADEHAGHGRWVAAGDLMRTKAGHPGWASGYYGEGWNRDGPETVPCGQRLLDECLVGRDWPMVDQLLDAAEARFGPPRAGDAAGFFGYAREVGEVFLPPDRRADLDDRVRLLFARHLAAGGDDRLFGPPGRWPGPVVRDAGYAARGRPVPPPALEPARSVALAPGPVTAVAVARDTGDVVVGTPAAVVFWSVGTGHVYPIVGNGGRRALGVAVDPAGTTVYVLREAGDGAVLRCFTRRPGGFEAAGQMRFEPDDGEGSWALMPDAVGGDEPWAVVATPTGRTTLRGRYLTPHPFSPNPPQSGPAYLLVTTPDQAEWEWEDGFLYYSPVSPGAAARWAIPWRPRRPTHTSPFVHPDWLGPAPGVLEVAGVSEAGTLHWSMFDGRQRDPVTASSRPASGSPAGSYLVACLTGHERVAAATGAGEVLWLRVRGYGFERWAPPTRLNVPTRVVYLANRPGADEVVAVLGDGSGVRLPLPAPARPAWMSPEAQVGYLRPPRPEVP